MSTPPMNGQRRRYGRSRAALLEALLGGLLLWSAPACKDPEARDPRALPSAAAAPRPAAPSPPPASLQDMGNLQKHVLSARPATIQQPADVTFMGGAIRFLGTDFDPPDPQPGGIVVVTNYYQVEKPVGGQWSLFAHVAAVQGNQLQMVGNHDHVPVNNAYPVSQWQPGQVIGDAWSMQLPAEAPPQLIVLVGFWQGDTRMPVDPPAPGTPTRTDGQNRVLAGVLRVGGAAAARTPDAPSYPLPTYLVTRTTGPITIDGQIVEPAWEKAVSTPPFVNSLDGRPTHTRTTAKLLYDDAYLYVAFNAQDEDIWGTYTQKDDPIYNEEAVEVFIDADGDGKTYNELEVSPHNVIFDAAFDYRRSDLEKAKQWDSQMQTAVQVNGTLDDGNDVDQSWTVEMKIPMNRLYAVPRLPPQPGDTWRFNLYRLDKYDHRRITDGQAFSPPLVGDFHATNRFAYLKFGP